MRSGYPVNMTRRIAEVRVMQRLGLADVYGDAAARQRYCQMQDDNATVAVPS